MCLLAVHMGKLKPRPSLLQVAIERRFFYWLNEDVLHGCFSVEAWACAVAV